MDKPLLLSELRALVATAPDFARYTSTSALHHEWLGKAHALVHRWNQFEAVGLQLAADGMSSELMRAMNITKIMNTLQRAIADLDIEVGKLPGGAFGPGAVYDAMRALRELLSSAKKEIFVVDPYMDAEIIDSYISATGKGVAVRLLYDKVAASLPPAINAFRSQHAANIQARRSHQLHDRVIFLDQQSCYVLGQSLKDAAKRKATYLAPLSAEISLLKLPMYEHLWTTATPV